MTFSVETVLDLLQRIDLEIGLCVFRMKYVLIRLRLTDQYATSMLYHCDYRVDVSITIHLNLKILFIFI